jgi:hypothetical protein
MTRKNAGRERRFPPAELATSLTEAELAELILAVLADPFAPPKPGPVPFRGPGQRYKSYCPACDLVLRGAMTCSSCGGKTLQMGTAWRPGRKGARTRVWDVRAHRNQRQANVPDVVRRLGVRGLPPRSRYWWGAPDPVHQAITVRGQRQRSRRRRNRQEAAS